MWRRAASACAKLDSVAAVAGESPRLFLKNYFRGGPGEILETLFELIPMLGTIKF